MLTLRAHLVALVLAVLLPALALAGATAWHMAQNYRRSFEERLSGTARALALAANADLGAAIAAVEALAASPLLDEPAGLAAFDAQARRVGAAFGSWVVVSRVADMRQLVNTRLPPGAPLPDTFAPGAVSAAAQARQAIVRDLVSVPFRPGQRLVTVLAPVLRGEGGPPASVVVMPLDPARLARLLEEQGLPEGAFAMLVDGQNVVVARSSGQAQFVGRPAPEWFAAANAGRERGLLRGPAIEGQKMILAFERLKAAPRWTVVVAEPLAAHRAAWLDPLFGLALGGFAALALAIILAAALSQRLVRPAVSLLHRAGALAAGEALPPSAGAPSPVAEFEALRAAFERADAALRTGEAEFRAAFEQAALPMVQSDYATGRYVRVNPAFCRLVGRPAEQLLGHHFSEFTHPDDLPAQRGAIRRVTRGEAVAYEVVKRLVLPDGSVRWVRVSSSPVRDASGRPIRTVAMFQDITESRAAAAALRESEARLRLAIEAARFGTWEFDLRRGTGSRAGRIAAEFPEVPTADFVFADWLENIHADDRATVEQAFAATAEGDAPHFAAEFRVRRPDGSWAWIASHGAAVARDPATGAPLRIAGVAQDITERKLAEERQALLTREVDHRAKNALAVVQATLRLTPKDDPAAYARAVEGRVAALARAHTLLAEGRWEGAALRALIEGELAPFLPAEAAPADGRQSAPADTPPTDDGRPPAVPAAPVSPPPPPLCIEIGGPPLTLAPAAAQALSMALHELATNATKHGALSVPGGRVAVSWHLDPAAGLLHLRWAESGGPPVLAPPARRGFGSRVIEATVKDQLGGRVERCWDPAGMACEFAVPLARALAGSGGRHPAG